MVEKHELVWDMFPWQKKAQFKWEDFSVPVGFRGWCLYKVIVRISKAGQGEEESFAKESDPSCSIFHFVVFDEKKMHPHAPLVTFKKVIPAMSLPMACF